MLYGNAVIDYCMIFAKIENFVRSLSRQDIQILVGYGCPSADKKVVFSAKLLRKLVHLDEGDVRVVLLPCYVSFGLKKWK